METNKPSSFSKYTNFISKVLGLNKNNNTANEENKDESSDKKNSSIDSIEALNKEIKVIKTFILDLSKIGQPSDLVLTNTQFKIEVIDQWLTCGWLAWEVMRKYTDYIAVIEKEANTKIKKKLIVAIKLYEKLPTSDDPYSNNVYNESLNYWVTQYERSLEPLKDGLIIIPHFSKYLPNRK